MIHGWRDRRALSRKLPGLGLGFDAVLRSNIPDAPGNVLVLPDLPEHGAIFRGGGPVGGPVLNSDPVGSSAPIPSR